ncbi:MAG: hypothetical protein FD189_593 [Elusimicrobia bacterium]|nr:MAG: hypothetical protein FD154_591 [Elusimicrobiota bacterium]KAF0157325.1 MAG: hypothetical protein FD189_593 [Elusimicrobiota bacterium]
MNLRAALRVSLLFVILAEVAVVHFLHLGHPYFWFENIPGFSSLYGFLSCVVIIFVSWLGKLFISRREDYYD